MKAKTIGKIIAIIGTLLLILIVITLINKATAKCKFEEHFFQEATEEINAICYYKSQDCLQSEERKLIDGDHACVYAPQGFIKNSIVYWGLGIFIIAFIGFFVYWIYSSSKGTEFEVGMFKKSDKINVKDAKKAIAYRIASDNGITLVDKEPKKGIINFFGSVDFGQKGKEWFAKLQAEVIEGKNPGVYTFIVSLSRGTEWITGGNIKMGMVGFGEYKISRDFPLHIPDDPRERMIENLYARSPEKALELYQQMPRAQDTLSADTGGMESELQKVPSRPYYNKRRSRYGRR